MEQLFYLLILLGLCLLHLGIKYMIYFSRAKLINEIPYVNKEDTFTLARADTHDLGLVETYLQRHLLVILVFI